MSILRRFLPKVLLLFPLLSLVIFPLVERDAGTAADPLTPEERAFVVAHGPIRYAPDPLFPPFESLDSSGVARGITPDLLAVIGRKLGVEFRTVAYPTWSDVLEAVKRGKVDLLGTLTRTPEREGFLLFSKPYLSVPYVLFVRQGGGDPKTFEDMVSRRLGVVKNYGINTWLSTEHPKIRPVVVEDAAMGLTMVATGQLDALLETLPVGAHIVREKSLTNIRIVSRPIYSLPQHFGVRKGEPLLLSIVQKGLDSLTETERSEAFVRWSGQDFSRPPPVISPLLRNALLLLAATAVLSWVWIVALRRNVRRATQSLQESRERYRAVAQSATDAIISADSAGNIVKWNQGAETIFGYSEADVIGQPATLLIPSRFREGHLAGMARMRDGGEPHVLGKVVEMEGVRKDGSEFPIEFSLAAWQVADRRYYTAIVRDITERKRAEETLKAQLAFREGIVECVAEGICVCHGTPDYPFVLFTVWNNRMTEITGYTMDEINRLGWYQSLYLDPDVQARASVRMDRMRLGDNLKGEEWEIIRSDGAKRLVSISTSLLDEGDKTVHVLALIQDITDRKRAEEEKRKLERQVQQAQKMESLGVLAGGIAHDFNNLLMAVLGHAELALNEISPMSAARGSLTEITTAARRAADLCRQMLAYAGKSSFSLERVGLRELVEEMAHLLKTAISKKAILNLNLERDLPPIQADPSQIRQVVMNLIINASEAIGDRSGVITVSVGATRCDDEYLRKTELREALSPGLYVHLEVADTGGGMDAETRSRIFEPFFSTKFTGRGLGLAAVLGIVRAYKGALKVYSEPGKGTTFKILFPALEDAGKEARPDDSSPLADWRGVGTILLVDDEESLLALGARMLEHLGFTVLTAADGLEAVELYRRRGKEIDLVLMDLTMPHMDGAEAFGELRRLNPEVRVVLASGYGHEDVASRFAGKGLDGVLQKPYTLLKLREALSGLLPKRPDEEG